MTVQRGIGTHLIQGGAAAALAAVLLAGSPGTSQAAMVSNLIEDLGTFNSATGPVTFTHIVPIGAFLDDYTFLLDQAANTTAMAVVGEVLPDVLPPLIPPDRKLDLSSLLLQIFVNTGDSNQPDPVASGTVGVDDLVQLTSDLGAGDYFLRVQGTAMGDDGGEYAGQIAVSAIPLPPAVLLLLSGLIALAGVSRAKRASRT